MNAAIEAEGVIFEPVYSPNFMRIRKGSTMRRYTGFFLLTMMVFISCAARATELKDFAGTWVMRLGDRNIFVLTLKVENTSLSGVWNRPSKYQSTNGAFGNIRGGIRHDRVTQVRLSDGVLHITAQNAIDPKDEDTYAMTVNGDHASLGYDDLGSGVVVAPMQFERAAPDATVATDWEPNRLYTSSDSDNSSAEMKAIFTEDQRVRTIPNVDWDMVSKTDAQRRDQTRKLLAAGALHTGTDYEEAAFVFQHGDKAEDYLLAHTLAMVAVSKGDSTAIWIVAATLDRYLKQIGQKQVFGTQFFTDPKNHWTQEPYDRDLVSDALRRQLAVPTKDLQNEQLKAYQAQN